MSTKKLPKYTVVGGIEKGKCGRILSKHRTLKSARQSAKRYAKKGYSGAIQRRQKLRGSTRKKYGEYGYKADARKGDMF